MKPYKFLSNSKIKIFKLAQTSRRGKNSLKTSEALNPTRLLSVTDPQYDASLVLRWFIVGGFTLVELLVAMVLAFLVITPLFGFMINIMDSERKEQAKAISEQEIQSALDYIAQDLEQAVYIYDDDGIAAIKNQLPSPTAPDSYRVPVLVFWKRNFKHNAVPWSSSHTCPPASGTPEPDNCNDAFVYSLVAYYLVKHNNSTNSICSSAACIGRFEVSDGVRNTNSSTGTGYLSSYLPDDGFKLFDLTLPGNLKDKMNAWKKDPLKPYIVDILPLVDYIDQSNGSGVPTPEDCTSTNSSDAKLVPANNTTANALGIYSFYACVDSSRTLARVYIRGNALARITTDAIFNNSQSTYFPTAHIQIKGRGLLGAH